MLPIKRLRAHRARLQVLDRAARGLSPMSLLTLQSHCCYLPPGGPARSLRGGRRLKDPHLNLCRSRPRSPLRTLRNRQSSRLRIRAAGAWLPQKRSLQCCDRQRWRPPGCHFLLRAQLEMRRLSHPTATPSISARNQRRGAKPGVSATTASHLCGVSERSYAVRGLSNDYDGTRFLPVVI